MKYFYSFSIFLILIIINGYIFNFINDTFFQIQDSNEAFSQYSGKEVFFISIIFAPIVETIIFQYLAFYFLNNILKIKNNVIIIFIMSLLFGIAHHYNWIYVVMTFFSGAILNYCFVFFNKEKGLRFSFFITILLHSLYNLYGFLFVE